MPHDQPARRLKILVLYDQYSVFTNTVREHLDCFRQFSGHDVVYCHATQGAPLRFSLDLFDAILIHYSVRLAIPGHLSPEFESALSRCHKIKAQFIQDEYDNTWHTCAMLDRLGINVVFTCVPEQHIGKIYGRVRPGVAFVQVLTGYLPLGIDAARVKPLAERTVVLGYRGRKLPFRYGKLAREKYTIGVRMRQACEQRRVAHDIEWSEDKRIYGPAWVDFVANCRATLGSESGSNVFDFDGTLLPAVNATLKRKPRLSFDTIYHRFLKDREIDGLMNQISPRIFEAIALRTGLVLFEGTYSNLIRPDEHFISLRKDFSNLDDVFARIQDDRYLADMTDRAYQHIVSSGRYTYQRFVRDVMGEIEERVGNSEASQLVAHVFALSTPGGQHVSLENANLFDRPIDASKFAAPMVRLEQPAGQPARSARGFFGRSLRLAKHAMTHLLGTAERKSA